MKQTIFFVSGATLILVALMMNSSSDSPSAGAPSQTGQRHAQPNPLAGYVPNLPLSQGELARLQQRDIKILTSVKLDDVSVGYKLGAVGIRKGHDGERNGPSSFVYLGRDKKQIAILDSQNNRINVYATDGSTKKGRSITLPDHIVERDANGNEVRINGKMSGFGMAVDDKGELKVLMRFTRDGATGADPVYEVRSIDTTAADARWSQPQKFTFNSHETHFTAQALPVEPFGNDLLVAGLNDNEFHRVNLQSATSTLSEVYPGYPLGTNPTNFVRIVPDPTSTQHEMSVQIVDGGTKTPTGQPTDVHVLQEVKIPNENIRRLHGYRILQSNLLKSKLLMLELDALDQENRPREIRFYDLSTGQAVEKGGITLESNPAVNVDVTTYVTKDSIYNLAFGKKNNTEHFRVDETHLVEE